MNWNWVLEFSSELESELELAFLGERKRKENFKKSLEKRTRIEG